MKDKTMIKPMNLSFLLALSAMGLCSMASLSQEITAENPNMIPARAQPAQKRYDVWVEDCLEKVWQDKAMPANAAKEVIIHSARGEYEAAQVAVNPKDDSVGALRAAATVLKHTDSGRTLSAPRVRYVDYVPVGKNTWHTPAGELVVKAPAWVPDALYEVDDVPVWQNQTRPIWFTCHIPLDAQPGLYTGELKITLYYNRTGGYVADKAGEIMVPLKLHVHPATVPARRNLKVTNWICLDSMQKWNGCEFFDERFWKFARIYAENMAAHRQNMIIIPMYKFYTTGDLISFSADGHDLKFDFANFDRWAQTFLDAGFTYLEGSHLGWIDETIYCWFVRNGAVVQQDFRADTPEAERYLSQFLPALQSHLEQKGWLDIYYQHVRDEPADAHKATYDRTRALMRKYCPRIKTIEATHSSEIDPPTVMVPLLSDLGEKHELYKKMQDKGQEVWFYTACGPNGSYANRFLDLHLLKVRYLHWLNFKYNIPGFLEWGYNWWGNLSPFRDLTLTWSVGPLPPGDSYVVYPTPHGLLDSIRWECERDGIEDYELLKSLQAQDPAKAREICSSLIQGFDKYDIDVKRFRAARLKLLQALER
jgi:hypothetical protein